MQTRDKDHNWFQQQCNGNFINTVKPYQHGKLVTVVLVIDMAFRKNIRNRVEPHLIPILTRSYNCIIESKDQSWLVLQYNIMHTVLHAMIGALIRNCFSNAIFSCIQQLKQSPLLVCLSVCQSVCPPLFCHTPCLRISRDISRYPGVP